MKRSAEAVWQGGKDGKGTISTESRLLRAAQYSFSTRFENGIGTNPEELVAAAHAGCFTMALSFALEGAGFKADRVSTHASVSLENPEQKGWAVTAIHLDVDADVPGIDSAKFRELAEGAKANCPISKLLKAPITMAIKLAQSQAA